VPDAFILDAVRTPIGRAGGALADVRPDDLAAEAIGRLLERTKAPAERIADVYLGCANQAGEDNRNVARMAGLLAGLPVEVPGVTVNRLCASGLEAVTQASRALRLGDGDLFVAGGVESMTRAPWVLPKPSRAWPRGALGAADTALGWRLVNPRMPEEHTVGLGITAENVAERYGVSREDQDRFAARSHATAIAAREAGRFAEEIVPLSLPQRRGEPKLIEHDEGVRADTDLEKLAGLRAAFAPGGAVTAGNSSQLSDGAAALLIGTAEWAETLGVAPLARIVATAAAGVEPAYMGIGPVPAARLALARAGLSVSDLDLVELNEAFAAQAIASVRELGLDEERVNVNGGAIAIGHPLGCSGARLVGTLARELRRRGGRYGLAALCIGVGQGLAMIVENPEHA
jgi:3-oxoadipyl-CoA thiolase